jgi:hypothetical protein
MKKNAVAIIFENDLIEKNIFDYGQKNSLENLYEKLEIFQPDNTDGYLIDTSDLFFKKRNQINFDQIKKNQRQHYIKPKNIFELYTFSKKVKCVALYSLPDNFEYAHKQFLLKILSFKRLSISRLGYLSDNSIPKNNKIKNKLFYFVNYRIKYYFFRFLQILQIIKNVDFFFEASQKIIDDINNAKSKKIERLFPFLKLSYYKKKIRVNSQVYDNFLNHKPIIKNEYIVLVDSGFDHVDRIIREGKINTNQRETYYKQLKELLEKLSKIYNKKVIVCLHPKANYPKSKYFEEIKKSFNVVLNKTTEFIYKAEIVLFFESSAIVTAIMLKKKIINLNSKLMGRYYFKRNSLYKEKINLFQTDLNNFEFDNRENLEKLLNNKIKYYEDYINENIIFEKNITSSFQIKRSLKELFFNN